MLSKLRKILYTQRVEIVQGYNERRDCADQQLAEFIWACGFMPVPINNLPEHIEQCVEELQPAGIVLSGGNDLFAYGGNAPERDKVENKLIELAVQQNVPLLGFCRGMQMLAYHFGAELCNVENHVARRHIITGKIRKREVNSYHNYAVLEVPTDFEVLARTTDDGVIEAMRHRHQRLMAIMWHPEREHTFKEEDINLFKNFFV